MSRLIAIDPGYAYACACAEYDGGCLSRVWFARPDRVPHASLSGYDVVVWECPQVDARTRRSTVAVVRLATEGALLAGMYAGASGVRAIGVTPSVWKGAIPKPAHHAKMWRALDAAEREVLGGNDTARVIYDARSKGALDHWSRSGESYYPRSWRVHNLLDAAGIGLWQLGRKS